MPELGQDSAAEGARIMGPDGSVYFVPAAGRAAFVLPGAGGAINSPGSAQIPPPDVSGAHHDVRSKLGYLPQMPVAMC